MLCDPRVKETMEERQRNIEKTENQGLEGIQ